MTFRQLSKEEINILLSQGCFADNWTGITVKEGFSTVNIRNTLFEGKIKLGLFSGTVEVEKNIIRKCGIYNSTIRNCDISDKVYISEVKDLSNYIIEENVAIENIGSLAVREESTFGNGTEIEVLNEGGGRELPIFDKLSSQIAYLTVLYRHDKDFTDKLLGLIRDYCEKKRSDRGLIQSGARILNSQIIHNVFVGSYSIITGASLLEEGTISSCKEAPVIIGEGVIARKFIILSGSRVDGGALLEKSFVGQGVTMGKQYSAENSVFFANSEAFHGEASSLFAGPYTVTRHKSTLLIASLVSFFNGGSGTNQSNHMYKLGPLHQGILERGCKTGSYSYLLLPAHIGAFSVVLGKHYTNIDTSGFPFSYIMENKGKSELLPARNLFTSGTRRDSDKWPTRDIRKDPDKLDLIHLGLFSPCVAGKIVNVINTLKELDEKNDKNQDYVNCKGTIISRSHLSTGRMHYELALQLYLARELVDRIYALDDNSSVKDLRNILKAEGTDGTGRWVDICGLFSPASKIDELVDSLKTGKIRSFTELGKEFAAIYNNYNKYAWTWCSSIIHQQTGDKPENISIDGLIKIVTDWKTNAIRVNNLVLKDSEKEFDSGSRIGFGVDGDENTKDADFRSVRGVYEENKFVIGLQKESEEIEEKADRLIAVLERMKF